MHPKVSVVIAVYNPGANIDRLVDSLAAQTLADEDLEVLFIDDGSTDGTRERLEDVVATRATWSVTTIPNSGWPGRPRNIGTDLATGEYVFFADHDDEFLPEALDRMSAMGRANGSDIVYPKLVRSGRPTPYWSLAHRTVAAADPLGEVLTSRTVHKLYRRQFLKDCGARFPEGKVRLEDHNFSSQVLPHARVISVVADYPCYRWIHRSDGSNNSEAASRADTYWGHYTEVMRVAERTAGPGPLLDALRVVAMGQAFSRFPAAGYLQRSDDSRRDLFAAVHDHVVEQFPPALDHRLPVLKRVRVQALRSGDQATFDAIQRQRAQITFTISVTDVHWDDERLHLALGITMDDQAGGAFELDRLGEDLALPPAEGSADPAPAGERRLLPSDLGSAEVTVRHKGTGVEWPVATTVRLEQVAVGERVALRLHAQAHVDPAHGFFGAPLEDGRWSLFVRTQFLGETLTMAVPAPPDVELPAGLVAVSGRQAAVLRTGSGRLVLRVPADLDDLTTSVTQAHVVDGRLTLALDVPGDRDDPQFVAVQTRGDDSGRSIPVEDGTVTIAIGETSPGDILDFYVHSGTPEQPGRKRRLMYADGEVIEQPPLRLYRTTSGAFSVKHVRTTAEPADATAKPRAWLRRARRPRRDGERG